MDEAKKDKEESDNYNQAQKSSESLLKYPNELLNIQIANKEHADNIINTGTRIQDATDTIKNDNNSQRKDKGLSSFSR